jgi:hypothetical protein
VKINEPKIRFICREWHKYKLYRFMLCQYQVQDQKKRRKGKEDEFKKTINYHRDKSTTCYLELIIVLNKLNVFLIIRIVTSWWTMKKSKIKLKIKIEIPWKLCQFWNIQQLKEFIASLKLIRDENFQQIEIYWAYRFEFKVYDLWNMCFSG